MSMRATLPWRELSAAKPPAELRASATKKQTGTRREFVFTDLQVPHNGVKSSGIRKVKVALGGYRGDSPGACSKYGGRATRTHRRRGCVRLCQPPCERQTPY